MDIHQLLDLVIERNGSDLHIITGYYPAIRVDGTLYQMSSLPVLTKDITDNLLTSFLTDDQKENLFANKELDLAYEYKQNRFRINIYYTRGALSASFRAIPTKIRTIAELELPLQFNNVVDYSSGLVLVTGPTGEGKSTTLAALINSINIKYSKHILTIEDPIEFVFPPSK